MVCNARSLCPLTIDADELLERVQQLEQAQPPHHSHRFLIYRFPVSDTIRRRDHKLEESIIPFVIGDGQTRYVRTEQGWYYEHRLFGRGLAAEMEEELLWILEEMFC